MSTRPPDRKAAIIEAATELFAARGFSAVGVDDIGGQVGITGPAIYRHFKNKESLLDAVVLDSLRAFAVNPDAAGAGIDSVVGDAVAAALDRPAALATYVRERRRLSGQARAAMVSAERGLYRPWRTALRTANPALSDVQILTRQSAVLEAMSAVVLRPRSVPRPLLDRLLTEAMVGVLLAPPVKEPTGDGRPPPWYAPMSRRDQILRHAMALFRERGFHGVGIDEIGEAAGITGPTVYFHFASKVDILLHAFEQTGSRVVAAVHESTAHASSAADALGRLTASYSAVAADNVDLIVVAGREGYAVPEEDRPRLARRRREIRNSWVSVLREMRPDLAEGSARALVAGLFPLINVFVLRGSKAAEAGQLGLAWLSAREVPKLASV